MDEILDLFLKISKPDSAFPTENPNLPMTITILRCCRIDYKLATTKLEAEMAKLLTK